MDKVWFKLRQTHYPPGPEDVILSGGGDDSQSPISLGHCIPDLRHFDFPINRDAVVPFPIRMKVFKASAIDFEWDAARTARRGLKLAAGLPLAVALGLLTVKASVRFAFERSVDEHERYARLDTYFVQPNRRYVEQCLQTPALKSYVQGRDSWSFFMVTGVRVARAGKRETEESAKLEVEGGPEVDVPTLATAGLTANVGRDKTNKVKEGNVSDFVWAVRLAKVHKGILMTDWSIDPYTHRATYAAEGNQEVDVGAVVAANDMQGFRVVDDEEADEAIVIDAGDWQQEEEEHVQQERQEA